MVRMYADGELVYDSRLKTPGYDLSSLLGLKVTTGLNKGGTAEIILPPDHPAYGKFVSHRTIVEIYRDVWLSFRGRVLYSKDDFNRRRTVTCEGELCFFLDAPSRPYLHQASPAEIFAAVVDNYNAQVEDFKRFRVGEITVTDDNDYIRLESESAESCLDTIKKLLSRCGGYIVFTSDADGARVVNWYADLIYASRQEIEFGENLLDFTRGVDNPSLATGVLPYGAKNEETGERMTIASVNDGIDFIIDEEAVELRGTIIKPVYWDDVTVPDNLLRKAQQYLQTSRQLITSLDLTVVDLSYMDKNIDSYKVGDIIRVRSKPHGVDEDFRLIERTEDLLNPAGSSITLGKEVSTLTGASVEGDRQAQNEMDRIKHDVKVDYTLNTAQAVQAAERSLSSMIQQNSANIISRVAATELSVKGLQTRATVLEQEAGALSVSVVSIREGLDEKADRATVEEITEHFIFDENGLTITNSGTGMGIGISEQRVEFTGGSSATTVIKPDEMTTTNLRVGSRLDLGKFSFFPRTNGNLSFRYTGGASE